MIKYQEILRRLLEVEGGIFQNLCDAVLSSTEEDCNNIFKPGSQTLTTKTRPGTPDTYFVLPNKEYVLIEYTTESPADTKNVINKFKKDIDKCTSPEKTGVTIEEINKIICCCTADFSLEEHKALTEYGMEKGVRIDVRGIHSLARYLSSSCANIAKEYLGITLETYQILKPKVFAQEYESSGLATPLSNTFMHRQSEIGDLMTSIQSSSKISILTGPPGMGKSRLAMEAFEEVLKSAPQMLCFCISNKNAYLHDDLRTYLSKDNPYLFLVDDANRQTGHLESLLAILKESRVQNIHVVVTVRDYALAEVQRKCRDFKSDVIRVGRFTDGELSDILKTKDFEVAGEALTRILEISNGNARLAIMAAKVFNTSNDLCSLADVATLYDSYFESALGDRNVLSDPDLMRSLGLLSFFFSIDLENRDFILNASLRFGIEESKLRASLQELEKLELAESNEDLSIVKIGDQVLGTYFFYRTFLRDNVLSFRVVMEYYRTSHLGRIRDSIIPANNTFSHEKVYPKVDPILSEFWGLIMPDEVQSFAFLNLFWQYRKTDLFAFVNLKIEHSLVSANADAKFSVNSPNDWYGYDRDEYLLLLNNFFAEPGRDADTALLLSFLYTKAYPLVYAQLVQSIKTEFAINSGDKLSNYSRQLSLWTKVTDGLGKRDNLCISLFADLAPVIMKTGQRDLQSIIIHFKKLGEEYPLSLDHYINLRRLTWETAHQNFDFYKDELKGILLAFIQANSHVAYNIYHFDFNSLYDLFIDKFNSSVFADCYIVRELVRAISKNKINDDRLLFLKNNFNTIAYQYFLVLSSDKLRDREMFDYEFTDHEKYRRLKALEIKNTFKISTLDEFQNFYEKVLEIYAFKVTYINGIQHSVNIVLLNIFENHPNLILDIMRFMIESGNQSQIVPYHIFGNVWNKISVAENVFEMIKASEFSSRTAWLQNFLERIPYRLVEEKHASAYLELMETTKAAMNINGFALSSLFNGDKEIFNKAMAILSRRCVEQITVDDSLFMEYLERFEDINAVKKIYILQDKLQKHFDYQYKGLMAVVIRDEAFLMEYIKSLTLGYEGLSKTKYHDLHLIWLLPNAEKHLWDIMDYLAEKLTYSLSEDGLGIFFSGLEPQFSQRARALVLDYLTANHSNLIKVNLILDMVRNTFSDIEPRVFIFWLNKNSSLEDFKELKLQNSMLSGGGGTVFNDMRSNRMKIVLGFFDLLPADDLRFLGHKLYLEEWISIYTRAAVNERRRNFLYGE